MAKEKADTSAEHGESIVTSSIQKTPGGEIDTLTIAPRGETVVDIGEDEGGGVAVADKVAPTDPSANDDGDAEGNKNLADDVGAKKKPFKKTRDGRIAHLTALNHQAQSEKAAYLQELEELRAKAKNTEKELRKSDYAAVQHYGESLEAKLAMAKREHRDATDAGDSEKAAEIASRMAELHAKKAQVDAWRSANPDPTKETDEKEAQPEPKRETAQTQKVTQHPETARWIAENPWFDANSPEHDPDMAAEARAFASLLEARLKRVGNAAAIGSPDYFKLIDQHMQEQFGEEEGEQETPPPPPKRGLPNMSAGSGVAPARSSATGGRGGDESAVASPHQVRLTAEQAEVAHALILKHPNGKSFTPREKEIAYAKGLRTNNRKGA